MKVIHIESGLGNQMLGYAEYIAIKKNHPNESCYIETIIYEIQDASEYICQWNGYELDRIFGIEVPNIKSLFSVEQWKNVIEDVRRSRFWENSWKYGEPIVEALNKYGNLELTNICISNDIKIKKNPCRELLSEFFKTDLGYNFRRRLITIKPEKIICRTSQPERIFFNDDRDILCGFTLLFRFKGNRIEDISEEIKRAFKFPDFLDLRNKNISDSIINSNAVAIHVRRGDMIGGTKKYYSGGYFKRAVKLIKKNVTNPTFFVFSDPDSVQWVRENIEEIGLTQQDDVKFIDWNSGTESYRDMQLMTLCKHCITTISSFGWWASYLIEYQNKITISPEIQINTTHHC